MNILVPYNGSSDSKLALREGMGKIKRHGGRLILLYVFRRDDELSAKRKNHPSKKSKNKNANGITPHHEEAASDEAARHIDYAKRILGKEGWQIKSDIITAEGNPADEITRCVREKNIDLIILSAKKSYRLNYEINCSS